MYLTHLSLTHFRNYQRLDLDFQGPLVVLQGQNGQGKTNLLEAIFFLATSKPVHAQHEREIVDWRAQEEPIPYSRVAGQVRQQPNALNLEILLTPRGDGVNFTKQVKINGVAKRSMDLVGLLRAVLFLPEDIKLVDGAPGERRRYLDIALCQIDRDYCRTLADYQKVLAQRNSLLKTLRDQEANPRAESTEAQLGFWDEQLVRYGSMVIVKRHQFLIQLSQLASQRHLELSSGRETLTLQYLPSFNPGHLAAVDFERLTDERIVVDIADFDYAALDAVNVAGAYHAKLLSRRSREVAAGTSMYGPHRDDRRFVSNGRDLRTFGSRGQQRSAALALKLAELQAGTAATGITPLLLLDDVMSELDSLRRGALIAALGGVEQAIITTTDWEDFTPEFRNQAQRFQVKTGTVQPIDR
jgi:DNA replication and repair protein RecF